MNIHNHRTVIHHYNNEDEFVDHNPWFLLAVENRLNSYLQGRILTERVDTRLEARFPALFMQHSADSRTFQALMDRMNLHVDGGITRINTATERKVTALVNDDAMFEPLRTQIYHDALANFRAQQNGFDAEFQSKERARDEKIRKLNDRVDNLAATNWLIFGFGLLIGSSVTIVYR